MNFPQRLVLAGDGCGAPGAPYAGTVSSFLGPQISTPSSARWWLQAGEAGLSKCRAKRQGGAAEWDPLV